MRLARFHISFWFLSGIEFNKSLLTFHTGNVTRMPADNVTGTKCILRSFSAGNKTFYLFYQPHPPLFLDVAANNNCQHPNKKQSR